MLDPETDPSRRRLLGGLCAGALLLPSTPGRALTKADHAPFVTTPHEAVQRMLALAGTGPEDIVYDLGSGDGRIVIAAARDFGARAVGIEFDYRLNAVARVNAQADGVADRVRFLATGRRSLAQAALRFVLDAPEVSVVIPGIKTVAQAEENLAVSDVPELTAEEQAGIRHGLEEIGEDFL